MTPSAKPAAILEAAVSSADMANKTVLENINIQAGQGEIIGIIGPNGTEKTTLLKTLCGVLPPRQGEIYIKGEEIRGLSRSAMARTVARVAQTIDMPPMTVEAYVLMGGCPTSSGINSSSAAKM